MSDPLIIRKATVLEVPIVRPDEEIVHDSDRCRVRVSTWGTAPAAEVVLEVKCARVLGAMTYWTDHTEFGADLISDEHRWMARQIDALSDEEWQELLDLPLGWGVEGFLTRVRFRDVCVKVAEEAGVTGQGLALVRSLADEWDDPRELAECAVALTRHADTEEAR